MKTANPTKISMLTLGLAVLAFLAMPAGLQAQTQCVITNGVKYTQLPNLQGLDVWNSGPWMLADDFVCTNDGPITDIHIWGSWLSDSVALNSLTFTLGIYDDVPTNAANTFSHPGNLLWQETFAPGQYSESPFASGSESFLDPGPPAIIGTDQEAWFYCFYPTNPFVQMGASTAPKIYWLAAYANLPAGTTVYHYGWKTTATVQNDVSVHAPWPGALPLTGGGWVPTLEASTGGPLDLAFFLTTPTNYSPCLNFVCPSNLVLYMPCGFSCVTVSNYPPAFATNNCDPAAGVTVTYSPPPGFCFPLGTTPVTMMVSGGGQTNYCTFTVTVLNNPNCPPTNNPPCLDFVCPTNLMLYMPCGYSCLTVSNYPPPFATNYCSPFAGVTVTYSPPPGFCFPLGTTPVTMTVSGSGETSNCTFTVTVLNNPNCPPTNNPPCLDFVCPTNLMLYMPCGYSCLTVSNYPPPFATNYCSPFAGVTVTYSPPPGFCFPLGTTPVTMTVSGSGETSNCTFTVTVLNNPNCPSNPPPVVCVESDYEKYVQWPNTVSGFDVWNSPFVLADDFVCTNTGPISDIHLWGSWLSDSALTNTINFWLGIYDDVPAVTNFASGQVVPSHPGTNLMWQQWFSPGQYAETIWTNNASEHFLNPGVSNTIGSDTVVWYYCFYPTNAFEQTGTPTNSKTYWLAAYAQLPVGTPYEYGWKTTTNVQHDVSVYAPWPSQPPTNNPGWTPTFYQPPAGGPPVPLDLAFKVTMCGPVKIRQLTLTTVQLTWPGGGFLQSATNVTGPYLDIPTYPTSPYIDSSAIPPTNRFYRVRCY